MGDNIVKRARGMGFAPKLLPLLAFALLLVCTVMYSTEHAEAAVSPLIHSSDNLGTKYGTWGTTFTCATCHNNNTLTNVKRIAATVQTPTGSKPVVFLRMTASSTATNGVFGDDLRVYALNGSTNICEVCHHNTTHHQYTSAKITDRVANPHYNRQDCAGSCHPHGSGFKPIGCDGCHGNPPITASIGGGALNGLATPATGATSPASPGAHAAHVTVKGMICATCHTGTTMPTVSNSVQMGFVVNATNWPGFVGNAVFGSFSGHTPLAAPYTGVVSSNVGTTVTNSAGFRNSCNVYCHANWPGSNGSLNPSWVITDGSQKACGTCHGASSATPPTTASHVRHAGNGATSLAVACANCHGAHTDNSHVDGNVKWNLKGISSVARYKTPLGNYTTIGTTGAIAPSASYGSCSNVYCHSTVQGATGTGAPTTYATPTWGGATLTCGSCHKNMSTDATAPGSHVTHAQSTGTVYTCDVCHGTGYSATAVVYPSHVNNQINLSFTANGAGTTYSKTASFAPGSAAYGSCSTNNCHGAMNPTWGVNTAKQRCQKCHGYRSTGWNALNGATANTDVKAGTHFNHISSAGTTKYIKALSCAECHAASIALATDNVNSAGHFDTAGPAELSFNTLAKTGGQVPAYNSPAAGQCSNVYCHGAGLASNVSNPPSSRVASPTWSSPFLTGTAGTVGNGSTTPGTGDCSTCHGYPPMTSTHAGKLATDCTGCHNHVNANGTGFIDATLHVDGIIQAAGDCNSCHDYDTVGATYSAGTWTGGTWGKSSKDGLTPNEGWGAHAKHINFIKTRLAIATALDPKTQTFGVGVPANICGSCHTNLVANHTTGGSTVRTINFGDSTFKIGGTTGTSFLFGATNPVYNGTSGISSATTPKTCSNISCHYFTTPLWSTY